MPRLANFLAAALAAVAAAPSGAEAASVPWKDCGSKGFKISSVTASPYPFQKGTNASMTISGSLAATFSAGTYYQSASVWGYSIGNSTGNACGPFLDCPASAGPVDIVMTMNVPSNAPTATYDLTMTLTASDGSNVMCIDMDPEIGSGAAQEPADFFSGPSDDEPVNNELHFAYINKRASTWTAGHNERWEGLTYGHVRGLCGALKTPEFLRLPVRRAPVPASIPATFDSRQHWGSECPILNDIRDQGSCGSCWAVSAASTQTDRTCIFYNGTASPYLSGSDILSCCGFWCGSGCDGGYPSSAQSYWVSTGVVDGGVYGDTKACLPYQVAPCEHHVSGSRPPCVEGGDTPACPSTCENGADWASSKHFGATSYSVSSDPAQIQAEILAHGPVQASFTVYADFPSYKSGVYKQTSTDELGGHAVKIIGWGTENGTPYWLVVNSWNTDWGDNGLFKIVRGQDECGIEDGIVAGLPK